VEGSFLAASPARPTHCTGRSLAPAESATLHTQLRPNERGRKIAPHRPSRAKLSQAEPSRASGRTALGGFRRSAWGPPSQKSGRRKVATPHTNCAPKSERPDWPTPLAHFSPAEGPFPARAISPRRWESAPTLRATLRAPCSFVSPCLYKYIAARPHLAHNSLEWAQSRAQIGNRSRPLWAHFGRPKWPADDNANLIIDHCGRGRAAARRLCVRASDCALQTASCKLGQTASCEPQAAAGP